MARRTLDVLPDDVLYDILYHSSVRDILSLRQVSSKFYHLTHHRPIWANVYTRRPILLPPGPFSYQSAVDLEQTLKRSHLFEANWTSPCPCPVSSQTFVVSPVDSRYNTMRLFGRYLFIAGLAGFRCYDLESKNEECALIAVYDSIETIFDCVVENCSVGEGIDCQFFCALWNQEELRSVTLLRLRISQCSAKFELVKEVRLVRLPPQLYARVRIFGDILTLGPLCSGPIMLHIPTCQLYDLPPRDFFDNVPIARSEYAVTSNHLLCYSSSVPETILEVFPLPRRSTQPNDDDDDETPSVHILICSHKCIINRPIERALLLTERHYLHNNNDHYAHYTFIAISRLGSRFCFLDVSLVSDRVTTTWTNAEFEGEDSRNSSPSCYIPEKILMSGYARDGVSRLVAFTTRREAIAFTVSEDEDGKRVVRGRPIVADEELKIWTAVNAFDSVQGRMCRIESPGHIEVINFV